MNRPTRITLVVLGSGWAQLLLVAGLAILFATGPIVDRLVAGLPLLGAGLFVAMWLVIDRIVFDAGAVFVATLKAVILLIATAGSVLMAYRTLHGLVGEPILVF